uniref:G-protein coupled receptors family 2 profile 2 domain-containing protein n=1 Tax=Romanomermis culicivorax TaxID=13658 RepID=A0A915ILB4_ROMCU
MKFQVLDQTLYEQSCLGECTLPCDRDYMFDQASKKFTEKWMVVWSSICFVATLFTLLTFLLERDTRFRYPERPVVFLSLCYNLYAFGYLLRYILHGDSVKCQKSFNGFHMNLLVYSGSIEPALIVSSGMDNSYCVIVFTLLYYFYMASVIWWVVLSFAWYLSAVRQWGAESIANVSQYFHLIAWGLPALLSIAILIGRSLDASELTGLCFVGHHNTAALFGYLIIPLSIFLVIGIGFITIDLLAMRNIRKQMSLQQERTVDLIKFDKLMARIAIFSVTYGLPTAVVIGCYIYEYLYIQIWSTGLLSTNDQEKEDLTLDNCQEILQRHRPLLEIYMLKIFMSLIVGIATCTWVMSRKTFLTWKSTLCYCICMRFKNPAAKATVALIPQQQNQVNVRGQISRKPCELPLIDQQNFCATEMNVVEQQKNYTTSSDASSRQYDYRHYGKYRSGGGGLKKQPISGVSADL